MKVYGSNLCRFCVECMQILDRSGLKYDFLDITGNLQYMKEFLILRDKLPVFEEAKERGNIGIPFIVEDDGTFTMDYHRYERGE